jgi:hypothetical protein
MWRVKRRTHTSSHLDTMYAQVLAIGLLALPEKKGPGEQCMRCGDAHRNATRASAW